MVSSPGWKPPILYLVIKDGTRDVSMRFFRMISETSSMRSKWFLVLLVLALGVTTAGCGEESGEGRLGPSPPDEDDPGYVPPVSTSVGVDVSGAAWLESEYHSGISVLTPHSQGRIRGTRYQAVLLSLAIEIGEERRP